MQIRKVCIGLLMFLWASCGLQAQWSIDVKNILGDKVNTRIFLGYESPTQTPKEFTAEVIIRPSSTLEDPISVKIQTNQVPVIRALTLNKKKNLVGTYRAEPLAMAPVFIQKEVKLRTQ
ncbi:MAG: hypothetical protein AAFR59_09980, partial [Bacteroidota bacterium]